MLHTKFTNSEFLVSPTWGCKPIFSVKKLNEHKINFSYYRHPPYELPPYSDSQHLIKIFLSSGVIERSLGENSQQEQVCKGDVVIVPARTNHRASWIQDLEFLSLAIEPESIFIFSKEMIRNRSFELLPSFASTDTLTYGIGLALLNEFQHWYTNFNYTKSLLQTLTAHLLRKHSNIDKLVREDYDYSIKYRMDKAIAFIHKNLDRHLSLTKVASEIGIGKHHFCNQFHKYIGISPYHYILYQRVYKAKLLIRQHPELKMIDIALDCGFSSQSQFNKQFRSFTGTTPSAFRRNICCLLPQPKI